MKQTNPPDDSILTKGLCTTCVHVRVVESSHSFRFLLCGLSQTDPRFPKYPRLPVLSCSGYQKKP
jgi:hypothetical protein